MRKVALVGLLLLLGITNQQIPTRNDIVTQVGTATLTWSGAQPVGWSGSNRLVTRAEFIANVSNNGACAGTAQLHLIWSQILACKIIGSFSHSLLSNPTFNPPPGSFTSWTSTRGACASGVFNGQNTTDQDGDNGLTFASSGSCFAAAAVIVLSQTFSSVTGVPTNQTYSYWYNAPLATYQANVAPDCSTTDGTISSLVTKVNGTTIDTTVPILDGAWHRVNGTMTALVNGSNTLTVTATMKAARNQNERINNDGTFFCLTSYSNMPQTVNLDNFSLTATF